MSEQTHRVNVTITIVLFVMVSLSLLLGSSLRFQSAGDRPFHTDEAVQAWKAAEFLESGIVEYDPVDYHGPTLPMLAGAVCFLRGKRTFTEPTKADMRIAALLPGLLLMILPFVFINEIGKFGSCIASILCGLSPLFAYYGGVLIHESLYTLLLWLTLWLGWRWSKAELSRRRMIFACVTGIAAGLTIATKETWVLAAGSLTFLLLLAFLRSDFRKKTHLRIVSQWKEIASFLLVMMFVLVILFTSFFHDFEGLVDFQKTWPLMFSRSMGGGGFEGHNQPFYFHLRNLLFFRVHPAITFSEISILFPIILLFIPKVKMSFREAGVTFPLLGLLVALIQLIILSVFAYKTPWLVMSSWFGIILFVSSILNRSLSELTSIVLPTYSLFVVLVVSTSLYPQALKATGPLSTDTRNPWVYGHALPSVEKIDGTIRDMLVYSPASANVHIASSDYWPLPWYLRDLQNVGYYNALPSEWEKSDIIVTSPSLHQHSTRLKSDEYRMLIYGLLPERPLIVHLPRDTWNKWRDEQQEEEK